MHIIQEEIGLPKAQFAAAKGDMSHGTVTIGPLPPGFGMTLGNAMRRVLLSSLPGAAVTSVRASGVQHEYTSIKGVRESVLDLSLTLKELKLKKHNKDSEVITLEAKGPKAVTAKDLKTSSDIDVLNPDLVIAHVEKGGSMKLEIMVEKGVGYVPASERNKRTNEPGLIHIDARFSPVERVKFAVEEMRVGQRTNLEKLTLEVKTNGSLSAEEAVRFASQVLASYFTFFGLEKEKVEEQFMADFSRVSAVATEGDREAVKESYTPIEILNLSPRTLNALINAGVGSIEQLTKCTRATLSNFRGFGAKALEEVEDTLKERGLKLSDDNLDEA